MPSLVSLGQNASPPRREAEATMAVRDQEQDQASDVGRPRRRPLAAWRETLGALPPVLALVAVLLYGYLSIAYDQFYRRLGVDLSDVGLSYTGVLARSSGFVVAYMFFVALFVGLVVTSRLHVDQRRRLDPAKAARDARLLGAVNAVFAILLAATLVFPLVDAANAAHKAQVGFAVGPVRQRWGLGPISELPIVAIRADLATVEPSGKPGDAPAAERLRGSHLLYLGQSGGTVALYDPAVQQAVYVPAASIILRVLNCDGELASKLPDCRFWRS
jgi:hypothetical protein